MKEFNEEQASVFQRVEGLRSFPARGQVYVIACLGSPHLEIRRQICQEGRLGRAFHRYPFDCPAAGSVE